MERVEQAYRENRKLADRDLIKEGKYGTYQTVRRQYPFLIGSFIWFVELILRCAALSVRLLVRYRLGERAFSFSLLIGAFIWVRCFLYGDWKFNLPISEKTKSDIWSFQGIKDRMWDIVTPDMSDVWYPIKALFLFIFQFFGHLLNVVQGILSGAEINTGSVIYWHGYVLLALGLFHIISVVRRRMTLKPVYSYERGKSIFFSWLENTFITKRIKLTPLFIRMVIEPTFIVVLGVLLALITGQGSIISLFCISAGALAYEEYGVYQNQRHAVLDIHDSYFKGQRLEAELSQYDWLEGDKSQVQEIATVASEQDFQTMYSYIKRQKKTKIENGITAK